jgi:hypothetical protein
MPILGDQEVPLMGIMEAAGIGKKVAIQFKNAPFDKPTLITALGYKGRSGASGVAVGDLRKYGLIEGSGGQLRVTDLAQKLALPTSPSELLDAYSEMIGKVPLYRRLDDHYAGRIPSEDEFFVSLLHMTGADRASAEAARGRIYRSLTEVWNRRGGSPSPSAIPNGTVLSSPSPAHRLESWGSGPTETGVQPETIEFTAGSIHLRYPLSEPGIQLLRASLQGDHFWELLRDQLRTHRASLRPTETGHGPSQSTGEAK